MNVIHSAVRRSVRMDFVELSDLCRLTRPKNKREAQGVKASEIEETQECFERQTIWCFRQHDDKTVER
jgi:hypothetical protein